MKALMAAILLRLARFDQLRPDAQANPPDRQARQAAQRRRRKRNAVIAAHHVGQAIALEHPQQRTTRLLVCRRGQRLAPERIAAPPVHDRQRVAVGARAETKLPLEINRPHGVRHVHWRVRRAGMRAQVAAARRRGRDQAGALQPGPHRTRGRQRPLGMASAQHRQQFLGPPARMTSPQLEQRIHDERITRMRTRVGPARSLQQAGRTLVRVAPNPFVAGLPADVVAGAQLGDRADAPLVVGYELQTLIHG